jgi:hypothetical protein
MNTAMRNPAARLPLPPIPLTVNHPFVIGNVPWWWLSTSTRPVIAKPTRMTYSISPMPTWIRAVIRMPTIAITTMIRRMAVLIRMFGHVLVDVEPNTASTDGARTTTPETTPTSVR